MNENFIYQNLSSCDLRFEFFESIDSTNNLAKTRAKSGAAEGLVIIASHQSSGRGRMGRSFSSPRNTGIYMSILLRPSLSPEKSVLITTAAAVSVCRAIETLTSNEAKIKWVNDIFINDRKVCGILTEGGINPENENMDFAVLGIGINVYKPEDDFDEDIKDIAGFLFEKEQENLQEKLIVEIIKNFLEYYKNIESCPHYEYYKQKCFVINNEVKIFNNGRFITDGFAYDIDKDFALLVNLDNGENISLSSGEISIRTL